MLMLRSAKSGLLGVRWPMGFFKISPLYEIGSVCKKKKQLGAEYVVINHPGSFLSYENHFVAYRSIVLRR